MAGMSCTAQCQKPLGVGASGSNMVTAKLRVPAGAPIVPLPPRPAPQTSFVPAPAGASQPEVDPEFQAQIRQLFLASAPAKLAAVRDAAIAFVQDQGSSMQIPLLADLFRKLSFIGVPPYYLFQGRPTEGNEPFEVPIVEGYGIFESARSRISGLAKRARFCMSHESGKVQVVGVDEERIYMRYHRSRDPRNDGRFLVFRRDDRAFWLDDLVPWEGMGQPRVAAEPDLAAAGPE